MAGHIGQPEITAPVPTGEARVVRAEAVEDRCLQIAGVGRVLRLRRRATRMGSGQAAPSPIHFRSVAISASGSLFPGGIAPLETFANKRLW
jgi:hypothetical protein